MIITCPYCHTHYQVADGSLGAQGRKVKCAQCAKAWQAKPEPARPLEPIESDRLAWEQDDDTLFDPASEAELDADFETEPKKSMSRKKTAVQSGEDIAESDADDDNLLDAPLAGPLRIGPKRLAERQKALARRLPRARARRMAIAVCGVVLFMLIGGGLTFRDAVVRVFPELASVYAAFGMPVNVVGISFSDVRTLRSLRDGGEVMQISARLTNVSNRQVSVPPVLVDLVNANGLSVYQWTVNPAVQVMAPGDLFTFETQVSSPPDGAARVRLSFSNQTNRR